MNKLNNIKSNLDIYCSLTENIINSYNNNNINYKILKNLYDLGYLEEQNIFKDIKILNKEMSDFHSKISNINEQMNKKNNIMDNQIILNNQSNIIQNYMNNIINT